MKFESSQIAYPGRAFNNDPKENGELFDVLPQKHCGSSLKDERHQIGNILRIRRFCKCT